MTKVYAIVRGDGESASYSTPPDATAPYFDTRWAAQQAADDMQAAAPDATYSVVEVPELTRPPRGTRRAFKNLQQ